MARGKSNAPADSYYKVIGGKKYDRRMIELADALTKGRGDGRISIEDAQRLLDAVQDSGTYSATEKRTMEYIRKNYKFTKEGDAFFRTEIRRWAARKKEKKSGPSVPDVVAPPPPPPPVMPTTAQKSQRAFASKPALLVVLVLLLLALLFYFLFYRSGCSTLPKAPAAQQGGIPPQMPAETPRAKVSSELEEFVARQKISFRAEKTELTPASAKILDALAERLKSENVRIKITGHSCALGSKEINQRISEKRAQVVKEALVARGVPAERIDTQGAADTEPAGDNRTVAGRVASRRVTFRIVE